MPKAVNQNSCVCQAKIIGAMVKVFPDKQPFGEEYNGSVLQGESFDFQLVFKNINLSNDKWNTISVDSKIKDKIELFVVDSVPSTTVPDKTDSYYLSCASGVFPDVLRPFNALDLCLPRNRWKAVWVSICGTENLDAGCYSIKFNLSSQSGERIVSLEYTLEVIGAKLCETNLKLTNWMHYDCIADWHNVEPFGDAFYGIFEQNLKAYTEAGFNMLLTPLFTPPLDTKEGGDRSTIQTVGVKITGGKYFFDFSKLDKFIDFVTERGIKYIEFGHLFTQWGGKHCPKIMAEEGREYRRIFGWEDDSCGEKYTEFLDAFLPELVKYIDCKGIKEHCFFHITDEPPVDGIETYRHCVNAVKKHIGTIKTWDALSDYDFYKEGLVDIAVPVINGFENFSNKGIDELFVYYCCVPTDGYYTNRLLNMPLQRTRVLGFQLYLNGVCGFLHWGFNFYNSALSCFKINPYACTDAGGFFPSGDSFVVYPREGGVNQSIRLKAIAAGFNDYRALLTLESLIGKSAVLDMLKNEKMSGFTEYPTSFEWHRDFRNKINSEISVFVRKKRLK